VTTNARKPHNVLYHVVTILDQASIFKKDMMRKLSEDHGNSGKDSVRVFFCGSAIFERMFCSFTGSHFEGFYKSLQDKKKLFAVHQKIV